MSKRNDVKLLMIEANSEMEMGIPPNIAILVASVKKAGFNIDVFSTNEYKNSNVTGDDARINTLQVPPTDFGDVGTCYKDADIMDDFRLKIKEFNPDIIGLSTTEPTYNLGLKLLKSIENDSIFTIVGGAYAILSPETIIEEKCVNSVCVGEGEEALVQLCKSIQKGEIDYSIKNISEL